LRVVLDRLLCNGNILSTSNEIEPPHLGIRRKNGKECKAIERHQKPKTQVQKLAA
jgi:hypothetical protein